MKLDIDDLASKHSWIRIIRDTVRGYVGVWTLNYNAFEDVYELEYKTMPKKEVPKKAVHVTGKGETEWFLDMDGSGEFPEPGHCTAIDLYCWSKNNALDEALNIKHKTPIDPKLWIYLGIGGLALVVIILFYMR